MADKLQTYRAKRDFSRTREPSGGSSGEASGESGERLRFVIQKHDATRLHYDLRLELDGVFKSWAVTRGPSLDPHDKRLAVEVEDHPLDYGDFEGTIPAGEYGGGTVMLWDRGMWEPEGMTAAAGLAKGDLKFRLEGGKLHGSWVLVRMKHDRAGGRSKRTNWLLIKHRDEWAREGEGEAVLAADKSVASGRGMAQIAAGKGRAPTPFVMAAGTVPAAATPAADAVWDSGAGLAAEQRKAAMPGFIAPQLATLVERPPGGAGWVHEIKFDGYRMQLRVEGGRARLRTRTGLDWTDRFGSLAQAAAGLPDCVVDGEAVVLDGEGNPDFGALQQALSEGGGPLSYFAFDLLFADGADLRALPLRQRKERLQAVLEGVPGAIRFVAHFESGGDAVLHSACRMALEGIVSKKLDAPYRSGRGETWLKSKCRAGHEVVVGGWSTTGANFRSLLVGAQRDGAFVYLGRVGTGFGAAKVAKLLPRLRAVEQASSPFTGKSAPKRAAGLHWTRPELVAEIEFAGWGAEGLVRQAAFKGLREDKPAAEVVAEQAAPTAGDQASAKAETATSGTANSGTAKSGTGRSGGNVVMGVAITRPEKALWPQAGDDGVAVSKLDLARYFEAVGAAMVPHLAGRPCSLVRYPDGIAGGQFFQRHAMAGQSNLLGLVTVGDDRKPYLTVDRVEALAAVAQVGGLELHPGNGRPGEPERPGRLVFDLDPAPDVSFDAVIAAALELRERLDALGLPSFPKTTGGKGLHLVVPLASERSAPDWAATKGFCHAVCAAMAAAAPDRFLVNMSKKLRAGRIYLDYLRNDRLATAVAPFSPRGRAGATVSMPLNWPDIEPGLDPNRYTIRSVPGLLGRSKAWDGYADCGSALSRAIARQAKRTGSGS